jgi:hypothetical protein
MTEPASFLFDTRIRDLAKHLEALPDLDGACDRVEVRQPALGGRHPEHREVLPAPFGRGRFDDLPPPPPPPPPPMSPSFDPPTRPLGEPALDPPSRPAATESGVEPAPGAPAGGSAFAADDDGDRPTTPVDDGWDSGES